MIRKLFLNISARLPGKSYVPFSLSYDVNKLASISKGMLYIFEALFVICVDVFLPTSDNVSDLITIASIIKNGHSDAWLWALFMTMPIFANIGFTYYIWRDSKLDTPEEKRWTWLLVLLSLWPQWQAIKLIKRIFKYKRTGIYRDNEDLKRQSQVGSLEAYCESIPQYVIMTILYISKGGRLSCTLDDIQIIEIGSPNYINVHCGENNDTCPIGEVPFYQLFGNSTSFGSIHIPTHHWFKITYGLTTISCACGILRFLDVGPTRILERTGWRNWVGYILAFFSVFYCLKAKGNGLGSGGYVMRMLHNKFDYNADRNAREVKGHWCQDPALRSNETAESLQSDDFKLQIIIVWMIINLVPQFIFAVLNLIAVIGTKFKDIRRVLFKYPQLILCPTFSTYTFGAVHTNHWCYMIRCENATSTTKISISKHLTIVNSVLCFLPSFVIWICIIMYAKPQEETVKWSLFNVDVNPITHVFLSDIIPFVLAKICTFLAIHLNGKVGVLDTEHIHDILVTGRKGGKVRDIDQDDVYTLNKADPHRVMSGMNYDNEIRRKNSSVISTIQNE